MTKKFTIPVLIAFLGFFLVSNVALAQMEDTDVHPRGGRRGIGQITSIGSEQFTARSRKGEEHVIHVDGKTRFRNFDGTELALGDLEVGDWVAVIVRPDPELGPIARLVIVLPDDYDPGQRLGVRARGHITALDQAGGTIMLHSASGKDLTFSVNDNTVFKGAIDLFEDLQVGMLAGVAGMKQADGSLLAHVVVSRYRIIRIGGEVDSVDLGANSFSLINRQGDHVTILVDENTRFRSRAGEIAGLDDLQPGMFAAVSAKRIPDRGLVALVIVADTKDQLPVFDLKVVGKIIAIGQDDFTL